MTYRVIGENGAYLIQRKDSADAPWLTVSVPYDGPVSALADMHKMAAEKRLERAALAGAATVHGEVTV